MTQTKISACLVVHNEEKVIKRCLDSIKDVVDEIIVVHDGPCSDKTLDICKKYTNKIFIRKYIGEAEPHRPFSFSKATGEWILWIDADEYLSEELRKELKNLAEKKDVNAYMLAFEVPYKNRILKRIGIGNAYRLCFFRKDSYFMKGEIHEQPKIIGKIKKVELLLRHRPLYNKYCLERFKETDLRWAYIQAKRYIKAGKAKYPAVFYIFRGIGLFIFVIGRGLLHGSFLNSFPGLKISFLEALYNYYVNWYIFKMKLKNIKL